MGLVSERKEGREEGEAPRSGEFVEGHDRDLKNGSRFVFTTRKCI